MNANRAGPIDHRSRVCIDWGSPRNRAVVARVLKTFTMKPAARILGIETELLRYYVNKYHNEEISVGGWPKPTVKMLTTFVEDLAKEGLRPCLHMVAGGIRGTPPLDQVPDLQAACDKLLEAWPVVNPKRACTKRGETAPLIKEATSEVEPEPTHYVHHEYTGSWGVDEVRLAHLKANGYPDAIHFLNTRAFSCRTPLWKDPDESRYVCGRRVTSGTCCNVCDPKQTDRTYSAWKSNQFRKKLDAAKKKETL